MNPIQSSRLWPRTSSSCTFTAYIRWRANEGVGAFASGATIPSGSLPDLVVTINGYNNGPVTVSVLAENVIQHLLNYGIATWWSPAVGSVESNLRSAIETFDTGTGMNNINITVFFDGQFGSVYVG